MHNIAATFAMSVNNPPPAVGRDSTAIAPRPTGSTELVSDDSQYFINGTCQTQLIPRNKARRSSKSGRLRHFDFVEGWIRGSSTIVTKKDVNFADSIEFIRQNPIIRGGKTTRRGAFEMQSAQAISAAYDFNLTARDFMLADGAIESVVKAIPWSALINPSQSSELIFCYRSDRLRGRKHAADGGKFRRDCKNRASARGRARAWVATVGSIRRSKHGVPYSIARQQANA